jgi:predicted aspartyl protease
MLVYTHDYDSHYQPAMPVVEIQVRRRAGQTSAMLNAVVDSGADATMIPLQTLRQLNARKVRTGWLSGSAGERYQVDLYTIAVQIGEYRLIYVDAVGSERSDEVIVGRDVLNQFIVTLNAPGHVVEIAT